MQAAALQADQSYDTQDGFQATGERADALLAEISRRLDHAAPYELTLLAVKLGEVAHAIRQAASTELAVTAIGEAYADKRCAGCPRKPLLRRVT